MNENQYIKMFAWIHGSDPYSADAEIIKTNTGYELFSIDSFSEIEDFFTNTPPEIIGHNMAVAACSDLLACGVAPELLLQSWNIDDSKSDDYYHKIATGIEAVLKHFGARCIGGDFGSCTSWSYTATVIANSTIPPVTRKASKRVPFDLYITGTFGDANLAAFMGKPMPEFELRSPVPAEVLFATDSSGGFFDALENFRRVNHGLHLNFEALKVISEHIFSEWPSDFDPLWSLVGGVGEYELIFALPKEVSTEAIKIGEGYFSDAQENQFTMFVDGKPLGKMKSSPPDYRNIIPAEWVRATKHYIQEMLIL